MTAFSSLAKIKTEYIAAAALLLTLIPFLSLCLFVQPSFIDDYCFATKTIEMGLMNAFLDWYNGWTGRYSLCFIMSLNPLLLQSFFLCQAILFGLIILFPLLFFILIKKIFPTQRFVFYLSITSLFTFLYFFQLPSVNEGLYWMTGALAYQLPNLCLLLLLYFLIDPSKKITKRCIHYLLASVTVIILIGTNEISMATFVVFLIALLVYHRYAKTDYDFGMVLLLGVSIVASIAVILSPGNALRGDLFPLAHHVFQAIKMTGLGLAYYSFKWLGMTCLTSVIGLYMLKKEKVNVQFHALRIPFRVSLGIFFIVLLTGFFVPAWATGQMPNPRAINVLFLIFLLGVWYHIAFGYQMLMKFDETLGTGKIATLLVVFALFFITFYPGSGIHNNIKTAYVDLLSGKAQRYDKAMRTLYQTGVVPQLTTESSPISIGHELGSIKQSYLGCPQQYFQKYYRPNKNGIRN